MTPARLLAILLPLALGACAEVTTFRRPDGSVYHHVDCGGTARLESCLHAAERICSNGYVRVPVSAVVRDSDPAARCVAGNAKRQQGGEAPTNCPAPPRRDAFFACK